MNLIIEQGNTSTKVAVFDKWRLELSSVFKEFSKNTIVPIMEEFSISKAIYSTVTDCDEELISYLRQALPFFIFLDNSIELPIKIDYKTPETLGRDRLAAVVGANYLQPMKDILVIDAGTAITYEVIESTGTYKGGNISPGMTTRFKALNLFTKRLPLLVERDDIPMLGNDTETAILAGVVNGIIFEMDGYIDYLKEKYPNLFVFLTGGHSFYFERRLKNSIFANINLVLLGLNRILEYNVEN